MQAALKPSSCLPQTFLPPWPEAKPHGNCFTRFPTNLNHLWMHLWRLPLPPGCITAMLPLHTMLCFVSYFYLQFIEVCLHSSQHSMESRGTKMTWQMLCCGQMSSGCGECCEGKGLMPHPGKAGRMQRKLVKCSSKTGRRTSSCTQPTWDQRGPYCSWSCWSRWRSRWNPSQTKGTSLRVSLHSVIPHERSPSLFP